MGNGALSSSPAVLPEARNNLPFQRYDDDANLAAGRTSVTLR